ncbi:trehalase-like domain-containing protein [Dictyobacter aurantiacus]|uniref:Trehalase-like N-terminal domain-containing protein n=1 Tax=Dictyobacter aurantiacus TaxID=1936993 RepID=A0A401ZKQ6_9CHLR|nr:trehalase-like domain-containing protein [Dictyobacter aurantiacus]GCE07435.1 hypothetical protein KDAU_47640 [Dictyobacter aurantiacus]
MEWGNESHQIYSLINAYGVVGDSHATVLIAPDGSIDWACLPDFDSPAILSRLLDERHGGYFQIAPTDGPQRGLQRYLHRTSALQTSFVRAAGAVELTDFIPMGTLQAWPRKVITINRVNVCRPHRCLIRMIECTYGSMSVTMDLKATPHNATVPAEVVLCPDSMGAFISGGLQHVVLVLSDVRMRAPFSIEIVQDAEEWHPTLRARFALCEGESLTLALAVEDSIQSAHQLFWDELLQRDFNTELIHSFGLAGTA